MYLDVGNAVKFIKEAESYINSGDFERASGILDSIKPEIDSERELMIFEPEEEQAKYKELIAMFDGTYKKAHTLAFHASFQLAEESLTKEPEKTYEYLMAISRHSSRI